MHKNDCQQNPESCYLWREAETREGFLGTSILLQFKTSKSEWWYMDGELFYIRYAFVCLKLFIFFIK